MRKIITVTAILTAMFIQTALAADGGTPAPVPGPYQSLKMPQQNTAAPTPYAAPRVQQPYWMQAPRLQVPYWMQSPQQPFVNANPVVKNNGNRGNASASAQAGGQMQGGFDFSAQARNSNAVNQGYGSNAAPGYFPGYVGSGPQVAPNAAPTSNTGFRPPITTNYQGYQVAPYPPQQGWNGPWNGNWNGPWSWQPIGPWGSGVPAGYGAPTGWGR